MKEKTQTNSEPSWLDLRNPVQGGHRLRWKADTRTVIADTW